MSGRFLTPEQTSRVYDRIGRFQDWQAIYEGPAIRELVALGSFASAQSIFEFGCGTGAFAANLLKIHAPSSCRYVGIDVSPKMVKLSTSRLQPWAGRAEIKLADGSPCLSEPNAGFDRFVSNYVFDLLPPDYAAKLLTEAHRLLSDSGKLCLVSLASGRSGMPRVVSALWAALWHLKPELVGGCRPIDLHSLLASDEWALSHSRTVVSFGLTSQVTVASRR